MRKDNSHFQALKPWCNLQWDFLRASTHPSVLPVKFQEVFHRTNVLFFFLFIFSLFNWRIIASQCCGVLCRTSMKTSHNFIYIYPLPLYPPPLHSTPLGHHRAPGWAPYIIQQLPSSILFHT